MMMVVLRSSKKLRARCSSPDWAPLPEDLLVLILHRLIQLSDYFRFGAVCKPWHAAADHQKVHRLRDKQEVPMLLILPPAKTAEEADYHCRRLYSVTQRKVLPNLIWSFEFLIPGGAVILAVLANPDRVEELAPRTTTKADKACLVKSCEGGRLVAGPEVSRK
ncbi:hypothetical protein C3L33_00027, partial [Rhododendron williamsianum]